MYKDTSPDAGFAKPTTEEAEVVPSSALTPPIEKAVVDAEVIIIGTRQGDPPAQNVLAKVLDDKRQVVSRPYGSIIEKTSLEELYKRLVDRATEQHDIILYLR